MKIKITCLLMLMALALFGQQDTSTIAIQLAKGLQLKEEGNFSEAISILDRAAVDLETQANWEKYIQTKVNIIHAYISLDSLEMAQQLIDQLTEEGHHYLTEPHHQLLNIQEAQVVLYRTSGLYEKGIAAAKKIIEERKLLFEETHPSLYKMYRELGTMHNVLSDYEVAIDYLKKGLFIIEKQYGKNHKTAAELYHAIGTNYAYQMRPAEAIPFYEKALKVNQAVYGPQSLQAANAYVMMGSIFCKIEQCSKGERNLLKALAIYKAVLGENSNDVGVAYLNLSTFYYYVPDYQKMLVYANKAVEILQQSAKTNNTNLVYALCNISLAYEELGDYRASIEANQKVLAFYASGYEAKNIYDLPDLSDYQIHSLALEMLFLQATKFDYYYEQNGDLKNLIAAADAYALAAKGVDEAQQIYQNESKAIFQNNLARLVYAWGIENTYKLFEQTQKKTYLSTAFNYLEKSHASLLYGALQDQKAQTLATIPSNLLEKEDQLKTQISQLKQQIYKAESVDSFATDSLAQWRFDLLNSKDQLRRLVEALEADFPLYHDLKYNLAVASLVDVQSRMPDNTSIIEYFVDDSDFGAVYALVVNKENSSFHRMKMPTQIEDTLKAFIELIKSPETAEAKGADWATYQQYVRQAQQLSALLIDSLQLKKNHDLVIIPDGMLHYLPFENLLAQKVAPTSVVNYASLPYLIKNHTIRYAYSATLLFKEPPAPNHQAIVAFAPSYEKSNNQYLAVRSGFTALAHTTDEVLKIQELVGAKVFTGLDATEAQFKQQTGPSKILHLAMHAFTNEEAPSYSGLVFAEDKNSMEDNTLHAYELYNMDIAAELLVLSACNTGSGKLAKGEGVMSLARAFRHAGCSNILMSLWQADDEATASIMQNFYRNLKDGSSTANALRSAKLNYLESSPKTFPHYWGAFVLMGADKNISFENQQLYWWVGGLLIFFGISLVLYRFLSSLNV